MQRLLVKYDDISSITTCGHSLGGALASLSAFALYDGKVWQIFYYIFFYIETVHHCISLTWQTWSS